MPDIKTYRSNSAGTPEVALTTVATSVYLACVTNRHATEVRFAHFKNGTGGTIISTLRLAAASQAIVPLPGTRYPKGVYVLVTTTFDGSAGNPSDSTTDLEIHADTSQL